MSSAMVRKPPLFRGTHSAISLQVREERLPEMFPEMQAKLMAPQAKLGVRAPGRARVEKIIGATIDLLREHHPSDINMAMLARHAEISRTSIYAHFASIEDIFEQISLRFTGQTGLFVESYVRGKRPANLKEVLIFTIDAICAFFNSKGGDGDNGDIRHIPFDMHVVIEDFDKVAALTYHTLWKVDWPVEPLSEFDPFRILVMLQSTLFSASINRYGHITPEFSDQAKRVACDYILGMDARFRAIVSATGQPPLSEAVGAGSRLAPGDVAEDKRRAERRAGTGIGHAREARRGIAGGVEAGNAAAAHAHHLGPGVDLRPALGAEHARDGPSKDMIEPYDSRRDQGRCGGFAPKRRRPRL